MISAILQLVVSTLTAGGKYSLLNRNNLTLPIHMQLPQKPKSFSGMFFAFSKYILNLEHFEKAMTFIAGVFPKLWTPKNVVR